MDFQAGHPALGPIERKMLILSSSSDIQVDTHEVSKKFPDRPRLSLLQREHDGTDIWICFAFPCECGDLPYGLRIREICD